MIKEYFIRLLLLPIADAMSPFSNHFVFWEIVFLLLFSAILFKSHKINTLLLFLSTIGVFIFSFLLAILVCYNSNNSGLYRLFWGDVQDSLSDATISIIKFLIIITILTISSKFIRQFHSSSLRSFLYFILFILMFFLQFAFDDMVFHRDYWLYDTVETFWKPFIPEFTYR